MNFAIENFLQETQAHINTDPRVSL